jgi:hypothetical protein
VVVPRGRILDNELDELLGSLAALAIEGPKGVGKTETASRRAATIHNLDDSNRLALAEANPKRLLDAETPILIDEWQRLPETWDLVRRAVDAGAGPSSCAARGAGPRGRSRAATSSPSTTAAASPDDRTGTRRNPAEEGSDRGHYAGGR